MIETASGFCSFSCCLVGKLLTHWATRMSYFKWRIWYISCPMRLWQVRFHFLVTILQCKLLYKAEQKVVPWKVMPDKLFFCWGCQVFSHLSFLYSANFLDIGQAKGVKWQEISDTSNFGRDHVKQSFLFLLFTVQTSETLGNKKE